MADPALVIWYGATGQVEAITGPEMRLEWCLLSNATWGWSLPTKLNGDMNHG